MPHQSSGIYMPNTDRHHVIIVIIKFSWMQRHILG